MKIGILGTRGIPNNHGGFEQFAQHLSVFLKEQGHEVYVYNSHNHAYSGNIYNGVKIIKCFDPEYKVGTLGQFIYDFNCIKDSQTQEFDILLQLGYTSSSVWKSLLPKKSIILTNMDGLEWKRSKYSKSVRKFLKYAEKLAVNSGDYLISDSRGIQEYLLNKYGSASTYIPYGAKLFDNPDKDYIENLELSPFEYSMLIARIEPENNIETILKGFLASSCVESQSLIVVGDCKSTAYGRKILKKYNHTKIRFLGSIYNMVELNNLRYFSRFYFHGHSVGGTNPSLLEAMASEALIIAHENPFNRDVLGDDAYFFQSVKDIKILLETNLYSKNHPFLELNKQKISSQYNWEQINNQYLNLFKKAHANLVKSI